jgi:16S rRNA (guanine1516-N2)-methyltransferase
MTTATPSAGTSVEVSYSETSARTAAAALAKTLSLPLIEPNDAAGFAGLLLLVTETGLELRDAHGAKLALEYRAAELHRYKPGASGRDLLRRALGPTVQRVVDATAGLGRDTVHMACLGYRVTAIERNPIVTTLAQDAIARAMPLLQDNVPTWLPGDARVILPTLAPRPDAVYLDPMFPAKRKTSAAVRKEMQMLRLLASDDSDAQQQLFTTAMACALERVVIKRPDDAPPLAGQPNASYPGKTVRYDVYFTKTR